MTRAIDLVSQQAAAGRGLWIGMYVPDGHGDLTGLHITLAHLGKTKNGPRALLADAILERIRWPSAIEAFTWGQARLDQWAGAVSVVLLEGADLHALRAGLVSELAKAPGLAPDRRFAFHPHLTLASHAKDAVIELRRRARQQVTLPALSLVCGEGRVDYRLAGDK